KWAVRNRVYTNKTHLRGFENLDFSLVRVGGLCLCSHEFYSLGLKFTPVIFATLLQQIQPWLRL
ncbi:MAG TPA: hypothetical protein VK203_13735, partial [Nostocaceae cyanobacterium]|nr:hypothetical protein [Nostocaceae cyanobacterium]